MKKRGRILGVIQFVASGTSRTHDPDDVSLAETIAGRVASSIENLRLHANQREIARTLQRSLLPSSLRLVPGVAVAVRYSANGRGTEVGGDFYDLFELDSDGRDGEGRFAVVMGDVCGTGPVAAAVTGMARHTIRDSAWHGDGPDAVLCSLNRAIRRSASNTFLTCAYGTLVTGGDTIGLTITCGGHPLPIHAGSSGATPMGRPGTLLGVFDDVDIHVASTTLAPDDVIVFHTDGATDVPPPHDLDEESWLALVERAAGSGDTADDVADAIQAALEEILPLASRNDDIALLVMKVRSTAAT